MTGDDAMTTHAKLRVLIVDDSASVRQVLKGILESDPESMRLPLRQAGFLSRDPRMKERKKYGLKRARKAPQYTKR